VKPGFAPNVSALVGVTTMYTRGVTVAPRLSGRRTFLDWGTGAPFGNEDCKVMVVEADPETAAGKLTLPDAPEAIWPNDIVCGEPSVTVWVIDAGNVAVGIGVGVGSTGVMPPLAPPPPPPPQATSVAATAAPANNNIDRTTSPCLFMMGALRATRKSSSQLCGSKVPAVASFFSHAACKDASSEPDRAQGREGAWCVRAKHWELCAIKDDKRT